MAKGKAKNQELIALQCTRVRPAQLHDDEESQEHPGQAGVHEVLPVGQEAHPPQGSKGKVGSVGVGRHRPVALMVERRSPKPDVAGSSPAWPGRRTVTSEGTEDMKKIILFFQESFAELKKVTWPSRDEVIASTKVVLVSTILIAARPRAGRLHPVQARRLDLLGRRQHGKGAGTSSIPIRGTRTRSRSTSACSSTRATLKDHVFDVKVPSEEVVEIKDGKEAVTSQEVPSRLHPGRDGPARTRAGRRSARTIRKIPGVTGFVGSNRNQKPQPITPGRGARRSCRRPARSRRTGSLKPRQTLLGRRDGADHRRPVRLVHGQHRGGQHGEGQAPGAWWGSSAAPPPSRSISCRWRRSRQPHEPPRARLARAGRRGWEPAAQVARMGALAARCADREALAPRRRRRMAKKTSQGDRQAAGAGEEGDAGAAGGTRARPARRAGAAVLPAVQRADQEHGGGRAHPGGHHGLHGQDLHVHHEDPARRGADQKASGSRRARRSRTRPRSASSPSDAAARRSPRRRCPTSTRTTSRRR